jgi:hypothetical protein
VRPEAKRRPPSFQSVVALLPDRFLLILYAPVAGDAQALSMDLRAENSYGANLMGRYLRESRI